MLRHMAGNVAAGLPRQVSIVGAQSWVQGAKKSNSTTTTALIRRVLQQALDEAKLRIQDIDGLIAVPSLREKHFMEAHYHATQLDLFAARPHLRCKTIDTGGAGPVSALLEGTRMIRDEGLECVAVVAADTVGSMDTTDFLLQADAIFCQLDPATPSPAIPHGYDRLTAYQMETFGVTRDQLRMAVCLESLHAGQHPKSLFRRKAMAAARDEDDNNNRNNNIPQQPLVTTLEQVQNAPAVTPNISLLECARRADGAACLILCSNRFLARQGIYRAGLPIVIGGGESSGPLSPRRGHKITEAHFSCEHAMGMAYASAGNLTAADVDFFALYDCFSVCLVRALEASGLCAKGKGGVYLEQQYQRMRQALSQDVAAQASSSSSLGDAPAPPQSHLDALLSDKSFFPVNTHGGLLCYGAPWEVPAMYNIVEAAQQLQGKAFGRQIPDCRRALVYGNGGIMSASAVAILSRSL